MQLFKRLSYRHKYFLLLAVLGLSAIAVYSLAIERTTAVIGEHRDLLHKMELLKDAPEQIASIEMQLKQMEQLVAHKEPLDLEQTLLEQVSDFSQKHNLMLIEFPKTNISSYQDYRIYINKMVVEGNFKNILQFIHNAEQGRKTGKIVSVQFKQAKDIRSKQLYLYAHIYFQNIQINSK
ncbi:MAG: hypothetical protein LBR81_03545 [Prevotellaceae bacterium]|jgi:hypothetical protein|nr:hypothetical protein [Prevotellaceae bacterium]